MKLRNVVFGFAVVMLMTLSLTVAVPGYGAALLPAPEGGTSSGTVAPTTNPAPPSCTASSTSATCATCEGATQNCVTCAPPNTKSDKLAPNQVYCSEPAPECGQTSCDLISKYVNPLITLLTGLVGVVVVLSIIYGAIQYSTSAGDPQKAAKARGHITKTVVALITYTFFYAFLQFLLPGGVFHK